MYDIIFSDKAKHDLKKLDYQLQNLIKNWINNHLTHDSHPRLYGKALSGQFKQYWSYRIGQYRIICEIDDKKKNVTIVSIAHRSRIYKQMVHESDIEYTVIAE